MTFDACVELQNVGKILGDHWVLREVNVSLPKGRVTAIIGPSGSGKTTLLRLINGLLRADEGTVSVFNEPVPIAKAHAFRRKIGYAVQGAGLFPHLTIEANITKLAKFEKWSQVQIDERLDELLTLTDLDPDLKSRYPYELSGGQQHRVSLCRALMLAPSMILLDEPFSAIDAITRTEIQESFSALQSKLQFSAVLVTHDFREAKKLADHLVVLSDGKVSQYGELESQIEKPATPFLQDLILTAS